MGGGSFTCGNVDEDRCGGALVEQARTENQVFPLDLKKWIQLGDYVHSIFDSKGHGRQGTRLRDLNPGAIENFKFGIREV